MDFSDNRSFKFGDAVFETLCVRFGEILFWEDHIERLMAGIQVLGLETPQYFLEEIRREAQALASQQQHARLRLHVWRNGGGAYLPDQNTAQYHLSINPLAQTPHAVTQPLRRVLIFRDIPLTYSSLSCLKTANSLPYILAAKYAQTHAAGDALLLSNDGNITETSCANIFYIKNNILYTPPLSDGCVAGVFRKNILMQCQQLRIPVREQSIAATAVSDIACMFACNVIRGIQPILQLENHSFSAPNHEILQQLIAVFRA